MCSAAEKPAATKSKIVSVARAFTRGAVIRIPEDYSCRLLDQATSDEISTALLATGLYRDLSLKRYIGLLLTRLCGWHKILFPDDDIVGLNPDKLSLVSRQLDRYGTASFLIPEFPNNTVVCHAHRLAGGKQGVFASGAALGINGSEDISFFPNIYNEDWFFLLGDVRQRRLARSGSLAQRIYDPYQDPARAVYEEFGDVLAEGLFALLHQQVGRRADQSYWSEFLGARRAFLADVSSRLASSRVAVDPKQGLDAARASVGGAAAHERLSVISATHCSGYVELMAEDLALWRSRLPELPTLEGLAAAADYLGLEVEPRTIRYRPAPREAATDRQHLGADLIDVHRADPIVTEALTPDDWRVLRDIQLRALKDAPNAFGTTTEEEADRSEDEWRASFRDARWFVVFKAGVPTAVGSSREYADDPDGRHIKAMWVAPESRRQGLARRLVDAIRADAAQREVRRIRLWVLDGNHTARDAYLAMGFVGSGKLQEFPKDPSRHEERMNLVDPL